MSIYEDGDRYLDLLNKWGIQQGYEPKYAKFKDYCNDRHKSPDTAERMIERAYNYFVNGETVKGAKPELTTYFDIPYKSDDSSTDELNSEDLKEFRQSKNENVNNNLNLHFLNNQMGDNNNKMDEGLNIAGIGNLFGGTGGKKVSKFWKDDDWVKNHQTAFKNTFTQISKPYEISYNPNYLRKDYFDYLKANNAKYENWTRDDTTDWDGDEINDIVVSDNKGNWRYFNGYSLNPKGLDKNNNPITTRGLRQQYILTNPQDEAFKTGYLPYLHTLPGHEKKEAKPYEDLIKAFLKVISKYYKKIAKGFNTHDKLVYQRSNYQGRLRSLINRYVVYPSILLGLGGNEEAVRKIIFAAPKSDEETLLRKIYQDKKDTIKNALKTNPQIKNDIGNVINAVQEKILNDVQVENVNPLQFLLALIKGDTTTIEKYFYNLVVQTLVK